MCPLQIINDSEPLSLTLHGVNACFIHHPFNVKNYSIGHKLETDRPKPKKNCYSGQHIFTPFCQFWGQNSKYPPLQKPATFSTSGKTSLNGPANDRQVTYSKIQNRLSRAPYDTPMYRFLMQYISNKCALILHEVSKNSPIRGWGGLSKMSKKMSIIELSQIGQDLFDFSDLTWGHPLTHSSTHRYLQTKSNYI